MPAIVTLGIRGLKAKGSALEREVPHSGGGGKNSDEGGLADRVSCRATHAVDQEGETIKSGQEKLRHYPNGGRGGRRKIEILAK